MVCACYMAENEPDGEQMDEVLTVAEVAEKLKCHPETIRELLRSGDLRGFKVGSDWRVSEFDLMAFIHRGRNGSNG